MAQLTAGRYLANITNIQGKEYKTKDNRKFQMIEITCDIIVDSKQFEETGKSPITTKRYYGNMEYTKKYFNDCNVTSATAIGKLINVTIEKTTFLDKEQKQVVTDKIKYFNFIDNDGNLIFPKIDKKDKKDNEVKLDF